MLKKKFKSFMICLGCTFKMPPTYSRQNVFRLYVCMFVLNAIAIPSPLDSETGLNGEFSLNRPRGRFSLVVAMSMCLYVCMSSPPYAIYVKASHWPTPGT